MLAVLAAAFLSPWTDVIACAALTVALLWTALESARDIARRPALRWSVGLGFDYLTIGVVSAQAGFFLAQTVNALARIPH